MNFIKNILSSLIAIWITFVIVLLIILGIGFSMSKNLIKEVKPNMVLEIDLKGELKEYLPFSVDPVSEILGTEKLTIGFNKVCKTIESAKLDKNIKGISLLNLPINLGWAQATALRRILEDFKQSGKFIYAYGDGYTQIDYYINSIADSLFVTPLGQIELEGLHPEVMFYKSFQEKYGVKMEVIRHGKYKSAVEPYIADEMSTANKNQIKQLINDIWKQVDASLQRSRNIPVEKSVMEGYGGSTQLALQHKLVDGVLYKDVYEEFLKEKLAVKKLEKISLKDYGSSQELYNVNLSNNKIAVVYAQGEIKYGEGNLDNIGQGLLTKALEAAAKNKEVKAIVLRIDSPGGSALASDLIWRAVKKVNAIKKVIVSMGNLAASGGYYIACAADRIFAEPTTITGSIGVYSMLPNAAELATKIGIHSEVVSTHNNGAYYSLVQPVNERFKNRKIKEIEEIYDAFLDRVAQGRKMSKSQVDEIAQGRVWSGAKALEIGLVDELGGLESAVAYAARIANLQEYQLKEYPEYKINFKELFGYESFLQSAMGKMIGLETEWTQMQQLKKVMTTKGVQARIPFDLRFK